MTVATTDTTALAIPLTGGVGANLIREAAAVMADAHRLAVAVCNTQMIPKHFQGKPDECAAAMLYGASLGLDPMQSVRQIYVVHGQAALYARAMVSLVLGAGHQVWTVKSTDESVTVAGKRRNSDHVEEVTWTIDRAKRAGYTNNEKYRTDPQAMLYSKAASEVCRKIAPDVLSGVYAVEELQMERWEQAGPATRGLAAALAPAAPDTPSEQPAPAEERAPEPQPEPATRAQLTKLHAALGNIGITDRAGALGFAGAFLGRDITTTKDLTKADASAVIDHAEALAAQAAAEEPVDAEVVEEGWPEVAQPGTASTR